HDTPATDVHTPSLHDALPIYPKGGIDGRAGDPVPVVMDLAGVKGHPQPDPSLPLVGPVVLSQRRGKLAGQPRRQDVFGQPWRHQDRKSTRLNSSHEWISYAVF